MYAGSIIGFSAGAPGGLFKSTDRGANWDTVFRGGSVADLDIDPHNPSTVYACLANYSAWTRPGVVKTTDGGASWAYCDSKITYGIERGPICLAIDPVHPDTLYLGTNGIGGGRLFKSVNGGGSWVMQYDSGVGPVAPTQIVVSPDSTQVIWVADLEKILRSPDGGTTWEPSSYSGGGGIHGMAISADGKRLYTGQGWSRFGPAAFFVSTDFGASWQPELTGLPDSAFIFALQLVPAGEGQEKVIAALGEKGVYEFGTDRMWRNLAGPWWVYALALADQGIIAGARDGVYLGEGTTAVRGEHLGRPEVAILENYPNPFNSSTEFRILVPQSGPVRLVVYDLLGREVKELLDDRMAAGVHTIRWEASGLSTGMYVCILSDGNTKVARKIVVQR